MTLTYDFIANASFTASSSVDLTSIPATYTDLRIVAVVTASTCSNLYMRLNSATSNGYHATSVYGSGSDPGGATEELATNFLKFTSDTTLSTTVPTLFEFDIMEYCGSPHPTILTTVSADYNGTGYVLRGVGRWASGTDINAVSLIPSTGTIDGTVNLYGIKRA